VTALHELGANINAASNNGTTAVMLAAESGHTATVTALHSLGADVNAADNNGATAIMLAGTYSDENVETIKALHSLKADLNAADNEGKTAVMYAEQKGHTETAATLRALGAK
jgi:ankyrin repeat protein